MSFTRKIIDGARSGLNTVMERIAADDTPLSHVDEELLGREVEARASARSATPRRAIENPVAKLAAATAGAREKRARLADERGKRIRSVRDQREQRARAAQEEAFREAKQRAYGQTSSRSSGAGSRTSSSGRRKPGGFPFGKSNDKLAQHYKTLDLPYGASFDEVKSSYRKLMRKYHPDRHVGNPKKQKAATELTMQVTQAYNELEAHLKENPNLTRR